MVKINRDWIDAYFQYGVDRVNRRVFMFDGVDETSIGIVIKALYYMDSESTEKPIELFIGSFGGSEYEMFALYDVIKTLKAPIHTTAIGKCMSAAPLLVACGEAGQRYATPNTWFMVHQSWCEWGEKDTDVLKRDIKHFDELEKVWVELMAKHTKKPAEFWLKKVREKGDVYFNAEEAQAYGLIDHIWDEKEGEVSE
jgi:ATP-dependent Clp protease protease subunit